MDDKDNNESTKKPPIKQKQPSPRGEGRKKSKASSSSSPKTKPKRALSAYNIFFHEERQKIQEERRAKFRDMIQNCASTDSIRAVESMGFVSLARHVASKWSTLDEASKAHYQALARNEQMRYDREQLRMEVEQQEQQQRQQQLKSSPVNNKGKISGSQQRFDEMIAALRNIRENAMVFNDNHHHQQPQPTNTIGNEQWFNERAMPVEDGKLVTHEESLSSSVGMLGYPDLPNWALSTMLQSATNPTTVAFTPSAASSTCGSSVASNSNSNSDASDRPTLMSPVEALHTALECMPGNEVTAKQTLFAPSETLHATTQSALVCKPALASTQLEQNIGTLIPPSDHLAHFHWIDHHPTMTSTGMSTAPSTATASPGQGMLQLSATLDVQMPSTIGLQQEQKQQSYENMLQELTTEMDEDEQEYFISCFACTNDDKSSNNNDNNVTE